MKINVHIGAHKTATTFLQDTLATNLADLRLAGIGYSPLSEFRPLITVRLENLVATGERIEGFLPQFYPSGLPQTSPRLILSDENLVGSCVDITDEGAPFLSGPRRLKALRDFLSGHQVTMFFAIRSYDVFIASAYCEALRALPQFVDFSIVKAQLKTKAFDWASIIDRFVDCLKPDQVKIWRFEDFRKRPESVVRALAFGYLGPIEEAPIWSVRPSFSHRAIERVSNLARTAGIGAATEMVKSIDTAMPKRKGEKSFYPWTGSEKAAWWSKYMEDCQRIDKDFWLALND